MRCLVVMGVSGCGKSTVAGVLSGRLGWDLIEGDDLHPPENVAKMAAGHPLDDTDRGPWLQSLRAAIDQELGAGRSVLVTCSALKRRYRDVLRGPAVTFVYLAGTREVLLARLTARQGHYMPASLLDSQLADLEPPGADEQAITVDIGPTPSVQADLVSDMLDL